MKLPMNRVHQRFAEAPDTIVPLPLCAGCTAGAAAIRLPTLYTAVHCLIDHCQQVLAPKLLHLYATHTLRLSAGSFHSLIICCSQFL